MYETIKKHAESDYLAILTAEQKNTYRQLQSARLPDGSQLSGASENINDAQSVEKVGAELYRIFFTDEPGYADTREAIKTKGVESAGDVVDILSEAVARQTGTQPSACVATIVYLIVTILHAGFAATLEGFSDESHASDE